MVDIRGGPVIENMFLFEGELTEDLGVIIGWRFSSEFVDSAREDMDIGCAFPWMLGGGKSKGNGEFEVEDAVDLENTSKS